MEFGPISAGDLTTVTRRTRSYCNCAARNLCGIDSTPYPFYPDFPTISNGAALHYLRNARPAVIIQERRPAMRIEIAEGGCIRRIRFEIRSSGKIYAILNRSYHRFFHLFVSCHFSLLAFSSRHPRNPFPCPDRNSFSSLSRDKSLLVHIIRFKRSVYTSCTPSYRVSKIQINFVPKHRAKGVVTTKARNSIPVVVVKISVPRRITRRLTVVTVGQEARLGEERYHPPFHGSFCEK